MVTEPTVTATAHEARVAEVGAARQVTVEGLVADESWESVATLLTGLRQALVAVHARIPIELSDAADRCEQALALAESNAYVLVARETPIATHGAPQNTPEGAENASGRSLSPT